MKNRIVVVTDCTDVAANELRAVLVSELDRLEARDVEVEPVVDAKEFSILHGNFLSRLIAESYAPETLTILAVVNALDTSDKRRARMAIRLNNGIKLVGANTGVFSWLIKEFGIAEMVETNTAGLKGDGFISFGGKYIHAPIAAQVAASDDLSTVKESDFTEDDLLMRDYPVGTIMHIDNFGVPKISLNSDEFEAVQGQYFSIKKDGKSIGTATYCHSMKELPSGELAIYKGSSLGLIEIGIVRQLDTAGTLGLAIGDQLEITADSSAAK